MFQDGYHRPEKGTEKEEMKSPEDEQLDKDESQEEEERSEGEKMQLQDDQGRPQEDRKQDQEIQHVEGAATRMNAPYNHDNLALVNRLLANLWIMKANTDWGITSS